MKFLTCMIFLAIHQLGRLSNSALGPCSTLKIDACIIMFLMRIIAADFLEAAGLDVEILRFINPFHIVMLAHSSQKIYPRT